MRTILHSDLNNFYASVELLKHPEYKGVPVVVCGSKEDRHGIVLAKNQIAKEMGVKTGEVLWQARRKCKNNLVEFKADFPSYVSMSEKVREIYYRFTDKIESFGIDECWLDVTESLKLFGTGEEIAEKIRKTIKDELGVTVSIGVSFNKVFAKLGSDMKKPDAVTVITPENYKNTVWKLPASDLLYVGKATVNKLKSIGIRTIGDIAVCEEKILKKLLGVWGVNLYRYANGLDDTPVLERGKEPAIKSIGNSMTNYRDAQNVEEVKILIMLLSESVAGRLRESGLGKARTVKLSVTDNNLITNGKQVSLEIPTHSAIDIARACYKMFDEIFFWQNRAVRGVGVAVSNFTMGAEQLMIGFDAEKEQRSDRLDQAVDKIRKKYGNVAVRRATVLQDERLFYSDVKGEHIVHPHSELANIDNENGDI
ncbi:MAG: DNA polymerase IV [Clostridia bacterium]|nr:DNA polymerase IV [Clostridia bacterium]